MQKLILLHGALGSIAELDELKNLLNDKFEIFTFNFEGHGGLAIKENFSMDLFSRNLLRYMDEHKIESCYVFGFSLGGYATLTAAINHPERFIKIMTLGSKFGWSPEIAEKEIKLINPDKIENKIPKYAEYLSTLHRPQDWKEIMKQLSYMIHNLGNGLALEHDDFAEIKSQCYIGVGEKDIMVSKEETKAVADAIPNAIFYSLEDTQHPLSSINKNRLANKILEFFEQ